MCLHKGPADEGDDDHRHPRGHLRETIRHVAVGQCKVISLHCAVERVEMAPVRLNLEDLVANNELLDCLARRRRAVQRRVARDGSLAGRLHLEEVQRRGVDRPRIRQNGLLFGIQVYKFRRIWHCGNVRQ